MSHRIPFLLLSLLLLFAQQEGRVHSFAHVGALLARPHQAVLAIPQAGDACVECALLAAGLALAVGAPPHHAAPGSVIESNPSRYASPGVGTPSWFSSRAPPSLV